jgi:ABC-type transport system involved in multi-copper enzyme maturation permease subunit
MNSKDPTANQPNALRQISLRNLVLGVLIKEKTRLLMLFLYLSANSVVIYLLSTAVIEKETTGSYANPTIVLYFRLLLISSPLIIGLLFGVPLLASEYESGTYRFLFTQGVGRRRLVTITFVVYLALILLLSGMTIFSVNHFLSLQRSAQFFTIWSFGLFICEPAIIIPLSLTAFIAGAFFGTLMKRAVPGIAVTLLFGVILSLTIKGLFDWLLGSLVQVLYDSARNMSHQHYDFYGHNDPKYFFQIQLLFATLTTVLTTVLIFVSVRALDSNGPFHERLKTSG